jgi:hypothetical protein
MSSPEVASLPLKLTVRSWLYQALTSGPREAVALACGAVSSYLSVKRLEPLWFPALSVHVPPTAVDGSSGPEYVVWLQLSMPDVASAPWWLTVTEWLYQPFLSVARAEEFACGFVESYFSDSEGVAVLPAMSVQVPLTAALPLSGPP